MPVVVVSDSQILDAVRRAERHETWLKSPEGMAHVASSKIEDQNMSKDIADFNSAAGVFVAIFVACACAYVIVNMPESKALPANLNTAMEGGSDV